MQESALKCCKSAWLCCSLAMQLWKILVEKAMWSVPLLIYSISRSTGKNCAGMMRLFPRSLTFTSPSLMIVGQVENVSPLASGSHEIEINLFLWLKIVLGVKGDGVQGVKPTFRCSQPWNSFWWAKLGVIQNS